MGKCKDKKEKKVLKSAWARAAHRIWDFGIAPAMFPFKLKRVPITLAYSFVGFPLLGPLLFPSAEEYLAERGLDPKIASELCDDTDSYVRSQDTLGRVHAALGDGFPHIAIETFNYLTSGGNGNMYAFLGFFGTQESLFNQGGLLVTDPEEFDARKFLSDCTGIPPALLETSPLSDEELCWFIIFHEIRHLDDDNRLKMPLYESDADYQAIQKHIEVFNKPEINDLIIHWRAMTSWNEEHETAVFLDYKKRGVKLPPAEVLVAAQVEAEAYIDAYADIWNEGDRREGFLKKRDMCLAAIARHGDEMSIHALRRLELYVEAAHYFAPSSFGLGGVKLDGRLPAIAPANENAAVRSMNRHLGL